ncbi:MAG: YebC/PmpR family DNA-binding transcriptional regulator [Microgenomates group bacterium]
MSGHSKWSNIKNKKAANDAAKGSVFTKMAKGITIAVKKGGGIGDPDMNFSLRLAIDKARSVNMPKENIDRAIDKGLGKAGEELAELTIEAFAPEGIMVIIELVTDSRNRAVAEIRTLIEKHGGRMGEPGSVNYLFEHAGIIQTEEKISDDVELELIDLGMTDMVSDGDSTTIYTEPEKMHAVIKKLHEKGILASGNVGYRPKTTVALADSTRVETFLEYISDYDDVQEVYANLG